MNMPELKLLKRAEKMGIEVGKWLLLDTWSKIKGNPVWTPSYKFSELII
jgi:hypothetical protein